MSAWASAIRASAAASGDVPLDRVMDQVAEQVAATALPQVLEPPKPGVQLVAVRPAWVRVRAADGSVLYEAVMNAGVCP